MVILARVSEMKPPRKSSLDALKPLVISAPFGNYIQPVGTTPTLGTFTAAARPGRVMQVLKTVRRYRRIGAWVNKIGLRNPGMPWLVERVKAGKVDVADKIVSIHGFTDADWRQLLEQAAAIKPLAVELNMSCPNVGEIIHDENLFADALATLPGAGVVPGVIVKLPPVRYAAMVEQAVDAGVRMFHCCNTLPVPAGGISGKPLMPLSLECVAALRQRYGNELRIIGGGGITTPEDIARYRDAGADHFAIGTKVMHPKYLWWHESLQLLIAAAQNQN